MDNESMRAGVAVRLVVVCRGSQGTANQGLQSALAPATHLEDEACVANRFAAERALAAEGFEARRWEPIGTLTRAGLRRAAYRVELIDGSAVKVRCFASERLAWRNEAMRRCIGAIDGVAPLRARVGRAVLEAWIVGAAVNGESPRTLMAAAELLARMHGVRLIGRRRMRVDRPTERWMGASHRRLETLVAAGAIDRATRDMLADALAHDDPGTAQLGVAHGDFCAENLVEGTDGRLHSIDNEAIRVDSLDADLAQTWYRWRMNDASFASFLHAYERLAGRTFEHPRFWQTAGLIKGAFVRVRFRLPGATEVLARLTRHAEQRAGAIHG